MSYSRRGRGFRGAYTPHARPSTVSGGKDLFDGLLKDVISTLAKPADKPGGDDIAIKDLQYLGSYNWIESKQPTVIVPGSPREWKDRLLPFQVSLDDETNFIDQNGYRMGSLALVPLIQVVEAINVDEDKPDFDWSSIDFVTDRNGLRKLLRWANATANKPARDFRIDTQLGGEKTVLFGRWEKRNREDPGSENRSPSYGFNFERATTNHAEGCKDSTGHHRIVTYDFDGLKMVVRFEVDACLPSTKRRDIKVKSTPQSPTTAPAASSGDGEDLADILSNLTIGSSVASSKNPTALNITWGGVEVPQSSVIEMTTRSELSVQHFDWADAYPQLYLSQTPLHYLAVHKKGRFSLVTKRQIGQGDFVQIEKEAQSGFRKLRGLLEVIQHLVKKHGLKGRISLVCTDGVLGVYQRSVGNSVLPDELLTLFDHKR